MEYILFDLDGTITDPKEGITKSIQYALHKMGIEVTDLDSLCKHIGPPLKEGFMNHWNMSEEEALKAVEGYREYFVPTGLYENVVYEGIEDVCKELLNQGMKLIVATSKPEIYAAAILKHFQLEKYFIDICGATLDGSRSKKGDVIRYALDKNKICDSDVVVMVGDRLHDVLGAQENNIPVVGVLYGYGSKEELKKAGADYIAGNLTELKEILLQNFKSQN
ncbi:phosphoglycolate phosphatase [Anaerocolumna cellulosilytica]|uniref:Phosphoglycolate phosphatase n=1 Tax=Anaerocolumna cellulosilytica TaxID=433286 RepID=A0A6S6R3U0_9FIRM|nr:HAD family hydrolase [Anaerocolumna cellulosilytica]MBB5195313.1 phosphoglycolate phosphatase [Anaerocolumna cellulosilytica]BCJ96786.1 phosphoglycolate phosphatase [Anaerocolumna cellulosilytica]